MNETREKVIQMMDKHNGAQINHCRGPNDTLLEFWLVKTTVVIVQYWTDKGCTHYVAGNSITWDDMDKELAAL